jgi:heme/copper-type cytochrome/quinol oxidase subunit 2
MPAMAQVAPISFYNIFMLVMFFLATVTAMLLTLILVLRRQKSQLVKFEPIHINDLIKLLISVATFVTVCITLVLLVLQNRTVVMQTRYALQSVESNVFSAVTTQNLAEDKVFIKYPEVRPFFYNGKKLSADDPLRQRVQATAEYLLDLFDSMCTQLKKYPQLWRHEKRAWEQNIIDMFAFSPVLCDYLEVNQHWYNDDLMALKRLGEQRRRVGLSQQSLAPLPASPAP